MRFISLIISIAIFSLNNFAQSYHIEWPNSNETEQTSQSGTYTLIMQDDFEGKTLNENNWSKIQRLKNSPQWRKHMSNNSSLYNLKNGRLRLYARENKGIEPKDTAKYLTGGITSKGKVNIKYGKIEVRARIKGAQGCWPAIWMGTESGASYPRYAEIDVMENVNNADKVYQTIHNNFTDKLKISTPKYQETSDVNIGQYNTYAVEILPNKVIFSINGKETMSYPKIETDKTGQYPFGNDSMYLMLDMQVGGVWVKYINSSDFPAYMDIDWVKFYRLNQ